jgi:hypothetical protein
LKCFRKLLSAHSPSPIPSEEGMMGIPVIKNQIFKNNFKEINQPTHITFIPWNTHLQHEMIALWNDLSLNKMNVMK